MGVDLGFVEGAAETKDLSATIVGGDELHLVVSPGHAWTTEAPDEAGLRTGAWVMREPGSGTREQMDAALGALGIETGSLPDKLELPSNEAVRAAVAMGGGATLLSGLVTAASLTAGGLVRVPFPAARRRFRLLRHPERHETAAARAFAALAVEPGE
jgi:DNA-binding transcriptional LysR family regulator